MSVEAEGKNGSETNRDIRESRAAQLSRFICEADPDVRASIGSILHNEPEKIDRWLFGPTASDGDASARPPAA
jgi:hypothetical protein